MTGVDMTDAQVGAALAPGWPPPAHTPSCLRRRPPPPPPPPHLLFGSVRCPGRLTPATSPASQLPAASSGWRRACSACLPPPSPPFPARAGQQARPGLLLPHAGLQAGEQPAPKDVPRPPRCPLLRRACTTPALPAAAPPRSPTSPSLGTPLPPCTAGSPTCDSSRARSRGWGRQGSRQAAWTSSSPTAWCALVASSAPAAGPLRPDVTDESSWQVAAHPRPRIATPCTRPIATPSMHPCPPAAAGQSDPRQAGGTGGGVPRAGPGGRDVLQRHVLHQEGTRGGAASGCRQACLFGACAWAASMPAEASAKSVPASPRRPHRSRMSAALRCSRSGGTAGRAALMALAAAAPWPHTAWASPCLRSCAQTRCCGTRGWRARCTPKTFCASAARSASWTPASSPPIPSRWALRMLGQGARARMRLLNSRRC